jgi:thioredoxin 1
MKPVDVTDENFEWLVTKSGKTVLVDFGAEWCPPCKAMRPVLELLASEFDGKALIGQLDVDLNPQLTAKYGVRNLPTFLIFKDGNLVERVVGAVPKSVLGQKITALI